MFKHKKILITAIIIIVILLVILSLPLFFKKSINKFYEQETVSTDNSLEKNKNFDSHFGFMHPEPDYQGVADTGTAWQRPHPGPFIWGDLESETGEFNWGQTDKWVTRSQEYDLNIIATVWPYAKWDQTTCHGKEDEIEPLEFNEFGKLRYKPCDMERYKKFVSALVERYDGDGEDDMDGLKFPLLVYEIINEPTMQGDFQPEINERDLYFFKGEPADYVELHKATYNAAKKTNSDVLIVNGGMAGLGPDEIEFWQQAVDLGVDQYIDIWNHHIVGDPDTDLFASEMSDFMDKNDIDKPFWITEMELGMQLEPTQAADHLIKAYVRAFALGADNIFFTHLTSVHEEKGLKLKPPNTLDRFSDNQEAMDAYAEMVEQIDYFTDVKEISDTEYEFTLPDKTVKINWNEQEIIYEDIN